MTSNWTDIEYSISYVEIIIVRAQMFINNFIGDNKQLIRWYLWYIHTKRFYSGTI